MKNPDQRLIGDIHFIRRLGTWYGYDGVSGTPRGPHWLLDQRPGPLPGETEAAIVSSEPPPDADAIMRDEIACHLERLRRIIDEAERDAERFVGWLAADDPRRFLRGAGLTRGQAARIDRVYRTVIEEYRTQLETDS